eukprot:g17240.t1
MMEAMEPETPAQDTDPENPPFADDEAGKSEQGGDTEEPKAEATADGEDPSAEPQKPAEGKEGSEGPGQGEGEQKPEAAKTEETDDELVEDVSDDTLNKYDRKVMKKKIRSAVQQRGREKSRADNLQAQLDSMTQSLGIEDPSKLAGVIQENAALAQTTVQFNQYLQQNNLQSDDVQKLLRAGAAITSGDWTTVKEIMGPYIDIMNAELGGELPADIRQGIADGRFDEETGKQLARDRAERSQAEIRADRAQSAAARAATQVQQTNKAVQQDNHQRSATEISQFMTRWAAKKAEKDPDFSVKEKLIINSLTARRATQGMPANTQVAEEWAEEALAEANNLLRPAAKPASTTKPSTPAPSGSGKQGAPAPQSLRDVVDLELSKARSA